MLQSIFFEVKTTGSIKIGRGGEGGAYNISTDMDGTKETAEQMQHKTQIN